MLSPAAPAQAIDIPFIHAGGEVAEDFRSRAARERAFAGRARDPKQARTAQALADRLDALADAYDRLDAATRR